MCAPVGASRGFRYHTIYICRSYLNYTTRAAMVYNRSDHVSDDLRQESALSVLATSTEAPTATIGQSVRKPSRIPSCKSSYLNSFSY